MIQASLRNHVFQSTPRIVIWQETNSIRIFFDGQISVAYVFEYRRCCTFCRMLHAHPVLAHSSSRHAVQLGTAQGYEGQKMKAATLSLRYYAIPDSKFTIQCMRDHVFCRTNS